MDNTSSSADEDTAALAEACGRHFPSDEDLAWRVSNCEGELSKYKSANTLKEQSVEDSGQTKFRSLSFLPPSPLFFFLPLLLQVLRIVSPWQSSSGWEGEAGMHFFVCGFSNLFELSDVFISDTFW